MGNVLAASSGAPGSGVSNLGLGLPEPAALPSDSGSLSESSSSAGGSDSFAASKDAPLENPGTVEELHKKCKGMWTSVRKTRSPAKTPQKALHTSDDITYNMRERDGAFRGVWGAPGVLLYIMYYQHYLTPTPRPSPLSDIQAITFEGAKIMLNKGLSNHFQVSHTINMSNVVPSGYRFGATYVGTKQYSPTEAFPVLLGDIDPSGNLNANIIHQFSARLRCKFASQVSSGGDWDEEKVQKVEDTIKSYPMAAWIYKLTTLGWNIQKSLGSLLYFSGFMLSYTFFAEKCLQLVKSYSHHILTTYVYQNLSNKVRL